MPNQKLINVALDRALVQKLLTGLHNGAKAKSLKVVISTDGEYHVESKEMKMLIVGSADGLNMEAIHVNNEKQAALVTAKDLSEMQLTELAGNVVKELREHYSPVFHSLADNIVVFGRAYGGTP